MKAPIVAVLCLGLLLGACTGLAENPVLATFKIVAFPPPADGKGHMDPHWQYLRVRVQDRTVYLALGDVEQDAQGSIEVWYSADREVLRLQEGRLLGLSGTPTEWREVRLPPLPSWTALATRQAPLHWTRVHDQMPGYHSGVTEHLVLQRIPAPHQSALRDLDPASLTWFEERHDPEDGLPPARYAVRFHQGQATVLYGEFCVSAPLCLAWQRWPAMPHD